MKAALFEKYGRPEDVVHVSEVDEPTPAEGQVLLEVRAASLNISDCYRITGFTRFFGGGITGPKDRGVSGDVAGRVRAVGSGVVRLRVGDEVFGTCAGAVAEYAVAREVKLAPKPANVSFEEAAAAPVAGLTALQCLRDKGAVKAGQEVLVNGASGGVGTFTVQIAKALGARVTGVCSTRNLDQARSIGADLVIDYTAEDFAKAGQTYDLIADIAANHSVSAYKRVLKPQGKCLIVGFPGNPVTGILKYSVLDKLGSVAGSKKVSFMGIAKINQEDLEVMANLMAERKVKSVIERIYQLNEAGQALQYVLGKHSRAKNVVLMS